MTMKPSRRATIFGRAFYLRLFGALTTLITSLLLAQPGYTRPTDVETFAETIVPGMDLQATSLVALPDGRYAVVGLAPSRIDPLQVNVVVAVYQPSLQPDYSASVDGSGVIVENPLSWISDRPGEAIEAVRLNRPAAAYHERNGIPGILVGVSLDTFDNLAYRTYTLVVRVPLSGARIGNLDPGFGTDGIVRVLELAPRSVRALDVTPDGRIFVAVSPSSTSAPGITMWRLHADGAADTSWGPAGQRTVSSPLLVPPAFRIEAQSDSGVLVMGLRAEGFRRDLAFGLFDSAGAPVPGFGGNSDGITIVRRSGGQHWLLDTTRDPQGRLVFLGQEVFGTSGGTYPLFVARLMQIGLLDTAFDDLYTFSGPGDGFIPVDANCAVRVQANGRIVLLGVGGAVSGALGLIALRPDLTDFDTSFTRNDIFDEVEYATIFPSNPPASTQDRFQSCAGMEIQPDGRIVLAATRARRDDPSQPFDSFVLLRLEGGDLPPLSGPDTIDFAAPSYTVREDAGTLRVGVVRGGGTEGTVTVAYRTVADTANAGLDFTPVSGVLTFADGETFAEIAIPIVNDSLFEGATPETFLVQLFDVTGRAVLGDGTENMLSVAVNIEDDGDSGQRAAIGFNPVAYTVSERDVAIQLALTRAADIVGVTEVQFETFDMSARAGVDYVANTGIVSFTSDERTATIIIAIRDNSQPGADREFGVRLLPTASSAGLIDPSRSTATVQITEDDVSLFVTDSVGAPDDQLIDFGAVEFNTFNSAVITLRNTGFLTVSFDEQPALAVSSGPSLYEAANSCGVNLIGGAQCEITIRFEPGATRVAVTGEVWVPTSTLAPTVIAVSGSAPPNANLGIGISASTPNPQPGGVAEFSVIALNLGPADAAESEVTIAVPAELVLATNTLQPMQGSVSFDAASRIITWLPGPLAATATARLAFSATVDAAVALGTVVTTTAAVLLTDPNRFDSNNLNNDDQVTMVVGVQAADLSIQDVRILGRDGTTPRTTIPLVRGCAGTVLTCDDPSRDIYRALDVTVHNAGPDASTGPLLLRITSIFCFDVQFVESGGLNEFRPMCPHGDVYDYPFDTSIPPGGEFVIRLWFTALTRRIGSEINPLETLEVEIVHGTFDPNEDNNVANSPGIQIVLPAPTPGADGSTLGFVGDYCFIATAAYGSWLDPHVATLRHFRDRWLLTNAPGQSFVDWYYRVSPPLADWIAARDWARALVRGVLAPVVLAIAYPVAAGVMLLLLIALLVFRRRLRPLLSFAIIGGSVRHP